MNMKKVAAIFRKQLKDTLKNKEVLIQFIMFPVIATIMQNSIRIEDMPRNYFVILFATMYIGMSPLTSTASILAEEKEKNTLRVLLMSNVKASEYLLGVGSYIFLICMLGSVIFAVVGQYRGIEFVLFLSIMALGILISILIGAGIGTLSKNQMSATSVTVIVMLIFSFLPMIAMFNEGVAKVSRFTFSQQLNDWLKGIGTISIHVDTIGILLLNMIVALLIFVLGYRRCKLA
ncbi:ABC transporter permease [Candidatus Galacturonibacter soehngenii]|uniref:ABC transporter permease n=1 Tax=Candidatus Galacturonatibacter soehngenii TaxID=2307010 RepID=A0A7V7QKQ0_9FIRM|nr:ABC transporter permease [Candidatus Galacturonibacter soehngenii]KAB1438412.1 ABC transporter permease [Candidatus Galacturonibacter soehngenii]